jgi:hypothetical protein
MTAGFGFERLGIWSACYPRATLVAVSIITAILLAAATQLGFSSDVREIFRSDSRDYRVLEEMARQYPGGEHDVFLTIEGDDLFTADGLESVRSVHLELLFADGVEGVTSLFSARHPPNADGKANPLFPDELFDIDLEQLKTAVVAHPLVTGKLLTDEGDFTLLVITLDDELPSLEHTSAILAEIKVLAEELVAEAGLSVGLTGIPAMRVEIIGALISDQVIFKITGLLLGTFLAWLFFGRWQYVILAGIPVWAAMIWLLGFMWLFGQQVNVLTNIVPTLVMVIAFSDTLHLLFAIRRNLPGEPTTRDAVVLAVRNVGPACVLTSLTTAIALSSLALLPQPFVGQFGILAALGTVIAYVATMASLPAAAVLMLRAGPSASPQPATARAFTVCTEAVSRTTAGLAQKHTIAASIASIAVLALSGFFYAQNEPHYSYRENLPTASPVFQTMTEIDTQLSGTTTLRVLVRGRDGVDILSPAALDVIRNTEVLLAADPQVRQVWALVDVVDWLTETDGDISEVLRLLRDADSRLTERLFSIDHNSALVTGHIPETDAARLLPLVANIEAELADIQAAAPDFTLDLTGIAVLSAEMSYAMIGNLNRSLLIAVLVIIILIGIAMRSLRAALVSVLPNLLPLTVGGAYLYFTGSGLQFTSVIAFTVGFGLAVDSTIHVLTRHRLECARGAAPEPALQQTMVVIGPVLIFGAFVFALGLGTTMLSSMPMVQLYGGISVIVVVTALVGDLILLPTTLFAVMRWRKSP